MTEATMQLSERMSDDDAADGCMYQRTTQDGDVISVWRMLFGNVRLCWRHAQSLPGTYDDGYCYASAVRAIVAASLWDGDGDPLDGWHRHPKTGRRRVDGDPATEVVRW